TRGGRAYRDGRREAADRDSGRAQGHLYHEGLAYHLRLENAFELREPVRRTRDRALQRGGGGDSRQDQHGRVRDGFLQRNFLLQAGEKSRERGLLAGRSLGRG